MATQLGRDFVLYAFEDLQPIGCEESCTISIVSEELITTTKGSGAWTNREYGRRDWNITANGLVGYSIAGRKEPTQFVNRIRNGQKVICKVTVADGFYFGIGMVRQADFTGAAEGFATYNVTIAGDGPLYLDGLGDLEPEPQWLEYSSTSFSITYSSPLLLNKTILFVLVGDVLYDATEYSYIEDNGSGSGVITFDVALSAGQTVKIIYS